MERVGPLVKALLTLGLALRLHHHFHGPPFDYGALAVGAFLSWVGIPGPGEPLLIAAGVLAAKHKLDLSSVLLVAGLAAAAGGIAGWVVGLNAGRRVLTARGPLRTLRLHGVARGDEVFRRYVVVAVLLAPSWISGIHHVRPAVYLPLNIASAALWAVGIGLGAYFIGPSVVEFVDDLGWVTATAIAVLIVGGIAAEVLRRRRRRARAGTAGAPDG
jgi:membrane protein DedA with SNARE-associated domain